MAAYRYWRVRPTVQNYTSSPLYSIATLEFRTSQGGAQAAVGGTASASSVLSSFVAANAFDTDPSSFWASDGVAPDQWIAYDFVAPIDIVEVAITSRSADFSQTPWIGWIESSTDGSTWTRRALISTSAWGASQTRVFAAQTDWENIPNVWRFRCSNANSTLEATSQVEVRDAVGGTNIALNAWATASSTLGGFNVLWATDNNTASEWISDGTSDPQDLIVWLTVLPSTVAEIAWRSRQSDAPEQTPSSILIQSGPDGVNWTDVATWTPDAWTSTGQTQTFALPVPEPPSGGGLTTLFRTSTMSTFRR